MSRFYLLLLVDTGLQLIYIEGVFVIGCITLPDDLIERFALLSSLQNSQGLISISIDDTYKVFRLCQFSRYKFDFIAPQL